MITFNNIVSKFQEFCDNHHFIQTFSYGSPSDVDLEKFEQYPLLHLVYTGGDYNSPKAKTYNLEVYILSLPPSKADKVDYQKESISDAEQVAEDILADIQNGGNIFQFGFHYDLVNASVTPLEEERSNALAGCLLDIAISVPYTYDSCNAPITGVEPDGSGIPSFKARGLLRVKELDGSPDVLSVATINVPNGSLVDDGDGEITLTFGGDAENATRLVQTVKNVSGGRLEKGTPVHAVVDGASGNLAYVIAARADTASAMPATFVLNETLDDEAEGEAIITGLISGVDTSAFSAGDVIYVGETGGYTNTKPTGTNLIQNLGIVLKRHASNGSGIVYGSGRSNDVPNIPEGYGWLGNASGVATPTLFNFYLNRFDDTASTMASTLDAGTATIERIDTARWTGTGVYLSQQSDTPSAGNAIKRKVYYKDEFGSTDAFGTWTLIHEFADDTSYADALTYINDTIIAGQNNGTAPASLVMTWEDTASFSGLLDDYPGAAAAYSLRLLDTTYTGSAIRVRRASDNAEQDIGFDDNELDTSALATFCAGTDGFVRTWYSQTGSNNATQTTTGNQPKIYDSATGVVTENGKPAVDFAVDVLYTNANISLSDGAYFSLVVGTTDGGANTVLSASDGSPRVGQFTRTSSGTDIQTIGFTSGGSAATATGPSVGVNTQFLGIGECTGTLLTAYANGTGGSAVSHTNRTDMAPFYVGARANNLGQAHAGIIQEIIHYPSDQSSNRTGIEANINTEYAIYGQSPTGLLADYPGAAAAYSLRQLISTANYAVAVRRASDNAVLPIGFVDGELDTTTLADFCSGTDGFVAVWFDQSGEGNHATQTTTSAQPKIYDSATGVVTENGKPAVEFDGVDNWMSASGFGEGAERSVFNTMKAVSDPASGYNNYWIFLQTASTVGNFLQLYSTSYDANLVANFQTNSLDITTSQGLQNQSLVSVIKGSSSSNLYKDGTSIGSGSGAQAMEDNLSIGRYSTNYAVQKQQEFVIYNSDQSANRTGIETNINDFYSIF